jgi:hypothetical protein
VFFLVLRLIKLHNLCGTDLRPTSVFLRRNSRRHVREAARSLRPPIDSADDAIFAAGRDDVGFLPGPIGFATNIGTLLVNAVQLLDLISRLDGSVG